MAAADDPAPPPLSTQADVDVEAASELHLARSRLKARVEAQQAADGSVSIPHHPAPIPSAASPPPSHEQELESAAAGTGTDDEQPRRGEEVENDEEEDEQVAEQLTGLRRRRRPAPAPAPEEEDQPTCRICFGGSGDDQEEERELGKLFSPCVCRGTSRYVHVKCLERWRKASANAASFYACDQCGYKYRFRRTRLAGVITSRYTLLSLTFLVFGLLVWMAGYAANSLIQVAEDRRSSLARGGFFDDFFVSDHVILGEGVREAVSFFDSGIAALAPREPQDSIEYTPEAQEGSNEPWTSRFYQTITGSSKSRAQRKVRSKFRSSTASLTVPEWLLSSLLHLAKGVSLIGIFASFQAYAAASIVSPLGRGLFRALRPQARRGPRDAAANNMSQLVVVALVVIGVFKAIGQVYRLVKWMTKIALSRVENLVLDVR